MQLIIILICLAFAASIIVACCLVLNARTRPIFTCPSCSATVDEDGYPVPHPSHKSYPSHLPAHPNRCQVCRAKHSRWILRNLDGQLSTTI